MTAKPLRSLRSGSGSYLDLDHCLFCLNNCSSLSSGEDEEAEKLNVPGAGNCDLLNEQLVQLFIVKNLLDMPSEWCESTLIEQQQIRDDKTNISGGVKFDGDVDVKVLGEELWRYKDQRWFNVCRKCIKIFVEPSWTAYQRLIRAEAKIRSVKEEIRRTMKAQILLKWKNKKWCGLKGEGPDVDLRKRLFPKLLLSVRSADLQGKPKTVVQKRKRPSYKEEDIGQDNPPQEQDDDQQDMDWEPTHDDDHFDHDFDTSSVKSPLTIKPSSQQKAKATPKMKTKQFKTSSSSTSALKLIRRIRKRTPRPRRPEDLKRFLCPQCGCYFHTDTQLSRHLEAHQNGPGPHDCDKCSYPALTPEDLHLHIKNRHNRIRYYPCPKCPIKAKSYKKLHLHMTTAHLDSMTEDDLLKNPKISLKCPLCSRQFLRLQTFTIHQRKMHPELFEESSPHPINCPSCDRKFPSKIRLEHHINSDHTKKPSKYVCDHCGKGFQFKCRLDYHMFNHLGKLQKDFICHLCGVDYSHPGMLSKHYRTVHPEDTKTEAPPTNFKCRYCDLTSPYKVVIRRHLKTHKDTTGHHCTKCGNSYMTPQSLRRHIRINHPLVKETVPCPHCLKLFETTDSMKHHVAKYCKLKTMNEPPPQPQAPPLFTLTSSPQPQPHAPSTIDINLIFP